MIKKIWNSRWIFRSIIKTVWFNFHYLPINQAIKLPILLYRPKFIECKGTIQLTGEIKFGMIQLGRNVVSIYPNTGIVYENKGGNLVFGGECLIGNASYMSLGKTSNVYIGNRFCASASFRFISYNRVYLENKVTFGWDCVLMDTDFHKMKKIEGGYTKGYGSINVGEGSWFGFQCTVLKNTKTPRYCTFASHSVISSDLSEYPDYSLFIPNVKPEVKVYGVYRDIDDDIITYN